MWLTITKESCFAAGPIKIIKLRLRSKRLVIWRPFCGRVFNHEQIGLVPIKREGSPAPEVKSIASNIQNKFHRYWTNIKNGLKILRKNNRKSNSRLNKKRSSRNRNLRKLKNLVRLTANGLKKWKTNIIRLPLRS